MTGDAVIVVPGILGSELVDNDTGQQIWGFSPKLLIKALTSGSAAFQALHLTSAERGGYYRRVTATGLLSIPTWLSWLRGSEDYLALLGAVREMAGPDAVHPFPYDWRLPVAYNGVRLAESVRHWLMAQRAGQLPEADGPSARLVFVAHSM